MQPAIEGNLLLSDITCDEIIQAVCRMLGPQHQSAPMLMHGSILTNAFDAYSDIDIIVVAPQTPEHLSVPLKGKLLDIKLSSVKFLCKEMQNEVHRGHDGLCEAIVSGVEIVGNWTALKDFARATIVQPPHEQLPEVYALQCSGALADMQRGAEQWERLQLASTLIESISALRLLNAGVRLARGRRLAARLYSTDPSLAEDLLLGVEEYLGSGCFSALERLACKVRRAVSPSEPSAIRFPKIV